MCEFKDFRRNIPCFKEYDENSFIGKWYDGVWDDEEYWKLENDLIEVRKKYPYPMDIPRDIVIGIGTIIDFLMVQNWKLFEIKVSLGLHKSVKINECYERFRVMLRYIFTDLDVEDWKFFYFPNVIKKLELEKFR
ncbi:immunity 41 family protein [Neisseria meningitidis]